MSDQKQEDTKNGRPKSRGQEEWQAKNKTGRKVGQKQEDMELGQKQQDRKNGRPKAR